jgi:hypothetical protein
MINELAFWGFFGLLVELCFTALRDLIIHKRFNLVGHTSLWMFPVYAFGLSYGFDFILWLIEDDITRYLTYPLWIWSVELLIGVPTSRKGIRLWDYSYLPRGFHWKGIISFAHYPLWTAFGILVELIK